MDNRLAMAGGSSAPAGSLGVSVTRDLGVLRSTSRWEAMRWKIKNFLTNGWRGLPALYVMKYVGKIFGVVYIKTSLSLKVIRGDGTVLNLGVVGRRVVTTTGGGFIIDAFQNLVELETMNYHGFGTGTGAEGASDTALGTEFTTEYATDNVRPTGSQSEASALVLQTIGTFVPNSGGTLAVTEHGLFSQAAVAGGVLLDRTKFSAVNLVASADQLVATYQFTVVAGS